MREVLDIKKLDYLYAQYVAETGNHMPHVNKILDNFAENKKRTPAANRIIGKRGIAMTDKEILTMAGQYGLWINGDMLEITDDALIEFVRAIEKEEREACAKLVEASCSGMEDDGFALAQLIRARGEE